MWLDLSTRQRVGFTDLSRANPALAQQWVEESKFYSLDVLAPKLRLSVADACKFELDTGTLVAARYEDKPQEQAKDRAEYQRQMNEYDQKRAMSGVGPDKFFWKGDRVSDEEWFGLLSVEGARVLACAVRRKFRSSKIERDATSEIGTGWRRRLAERGLVAG